VTWDEAVAGWWQSEVSADPAYAEVVIPLALDLIGPQPGEMWVDLGCGVGSVMRAVVGSGGSVVGCDSSASLARLASAAAPTVMARLPDLSWLGAAAVAGAYAVLVLEHLPDLAPLWAGCARAVRPGGALVAVLNHPVMTSPGSAPVFDPQDGEILWRWGEYLSPGSTTERAGSGTVVFHHRPLGLLMEEAAEAGWALQRMVERPAGAVQSSRDPLLEGQRQVPRLLGLRWERPA